MPKANLADLLFETGHERGDAARTVKDVRDNILRALVAGTDVSIPGLGILRVVERAAYTGMNPATGDAVAVPARRAVTFRPSADLKRALNGGAEAGE